MRACTLAEIEIGLLMEEAQILAGSFEMSEDHVKAEALAGLRGGACECGKGA